LACASAGYIAAPVAYAYEAQHLPVIDANGVPVDTPANQAAKAQHFAQKAYAQARNGDVAVVAAAAPVYPAYSAYSAYSAYPWAYPVAAPVVPADTPEVAAAKVQHFAAHAEALARNGHIRKRRGIVAPVASVAPVAYSAYPYASAYTSAYTTPLAYSSYAYPYTTSSYYGAYNALPYARYYY